MVQIIQQPKKNNQLLFSQTNFMNRCERCGFFRSFWQILQLDFDCEKNALITKGSERMRICRYSIQKWIFRLIFLKQLKWVYFLQNCVPINRFVCLVSLSYINLLQNHQIYFSIYRSTLLLLCLYTKTDHKSKPLTCSIDKNS